MNILSQTAHAISDHQFAKVFLDKSSGQKSLQAASDFSPGDLISHFSAGSTLDHPTRLTVQIAADQHITLLPEFLQYMNHSCDPNAFFNTTTMELISIKPIHAGEELTFFYPGTEWEMAEPFVCQCGSRDCLQLINGASHIPVETLTRYKVTDFIRQMKGMK